MFAGIHGAQRSGKSYFCIRTCIDFLRNTDRDIYTNLPVNPDYIARFVSGRKFRNLEKYYEIFRRIHIFQDFNSLSEAKEFAKKNRDFWRFCRFDQRHKKEFFKDYLAANGHYPSKEDWPLEYYEAGYIWPTKWIFDFWRLTKRQRTVFMFDEFYEYFSSMDYKSTGMEIRKQLLSFTRQHGHDNHHVYLISHNPGDLDAIIRNGFMYQYYIENAKYKNLFKNKWLKGLKSPVQYFRVYGFCSGDKEPQDVYPIWPEKAIFKCYNSNSTGSTLKEINQGNCKADKYDDNRGTNFIHNFKKYFVQQGWITFTVISSVCFGLYYLYKGYKSILPDKVKTGITAPDNNVLAQKQGRGAITQDLKVVGVFNNKVIWNDDFKLQKGDVYHGLQVEAINAKKESVVFSTPDGRYVAVPFSGCRITEQPAQPANQNGLKPKQ